MRWGCYETPKHPGKPPLHPSFKTSELQCNTLVEGAFQPSTLGLGPTAKTSRIPLIRVTPLLFVPKCFASHTKGHSKLIFREPLCRKLAGPMHPSEQGLPWKAQHPAPRPPAVNTKTDWGWPRFLNTFSEGHQDIMFMIFRPHAHVKNFVEAKRN